VGDALGHGAAAGGGDLFAGQHDGGIVRRARGWEG
jgi:hypothetical protein